MEHEYEPLVLCDVESDGTGKFTVSIDDEDHRFSVTASEEQVEIEYEETLSYRGEIRTKEPRDEVYDTLTSSEKFENFVTEFTK